MFVTQHELESNSTTGTSFHNQISSIGMFAFVLILLIIPMGLTVFLVSAHLIFPKIKKLFSDKIFFSESFMRKFDLVR